MHKVKQPVAKMKSVGEISVSTLRDELPNILSRIALLGETFTIMKHGKPYAVISPVGGDVLTGSVNGLDVQQGMSSEARGRK